MFIYFETIDGTSLCRGVRIGQAGPGTNRGPSAIRDSANTEDIDLGSGNGGYTGGRDGPPVPGRAETRDGASFPCRGSRY